MKNINKSIQEAKNLLEEKGFNVLAIFLYGSQNYEMETTLENKLRKIGEDFLIYKFNS